MTIIWFMVPEIWTVKNGIFYPFGPFSPFYPPKKTKNQNFEKLKQKNPGDIIILHKCSKNHDHMLYCSLDMVCDGCNCYFSFWAIFCPFPSLTTWKVKIFKKVKKKTTFRYYHFTQVQQKSWSYAIVYLRYGA